MFIFLGCAFFFLLRLLEASFVDIVCLSSNLSQSEHTLKNATFTELYGHGSKMSVNQVCGDAPRPRRAPKGLGSCGGCRWHLPSHPQINRSRLYRHYRFTEQQFKQRAQSVNYIFQNQQQELRECKRQTKHSRNRPEKRLDNVKYISA